VILAGLEQLEAGELPLPLGVLFGDLTFEVCPTAAERRRRPVIIEVFDADDDDAFGRLLRHQKIVSKLTQHLTRNWIDDILLNGESWQAYAT